jgi:aryl-alcohol dehydrogenase-like predicted oxidoreductase
MAALPKISRLILGTAPFGLPYGLGSSGQAVSRAEVERILALAWEHGIDTLDTAAAYGEAESVIGGAKSKQARFKIVSKTPRIGKDRIAKDDVEKVHAAARASIERLKIESLDSLLVHHAPDLLAPGGAEVFRALQALKQEGVAGRLGVSVYDAEVLNSVLTSYPIEVVQLPLNLLDQRFARDGTLAALAKRGIEVHARSIFLQGVLSTDPEKLPPRFENARARLSLLRSEATAAGMSAQAAALGYVSGCKEVTRIVIGVQSAGELMTDIAAFTNIPSRLDIDFSAYAMDDPEIIDPRRWTR